MHRRHFVTGAGASLLCRFARAEGKNDSAWTAACAAIEAEIGGRVGIAALDTGSGKRLAYRGDERFALCSTFKWLLVAAVLARVEQGTVSLDQRVAYTKADLLAYAPVTQSHVGEGSLPLADLCSAAIEVSDNTAANLLLRLIGGPKGLTRFLRHQGDRITRLDRTEPTLNSNLPGDMRDSTTPDAMVHTMAHLLVADGLVPQSRQRLVGWMRECQTGRQRLRAGVPADWQAGDKTGTGSHAAVNDCAIFWPPGRAPFVVAAYLSGSAAEPAVLDAAHARLGRLVAASLS